MSFPGQYRPGIFLGTPGSNLHVIDLTPKFCQSNIKSVSYGFKMNKALRSNKLSQRAENECAFAVSVLLLLNLMKHCNAKSVACIFSVLQQLSPNATCRFISHLLWGNENSRARICILCSITVGCIEIQLQWSFYELSKLIEEGLTWYAARFFKSWPDFRPKNVTSIPIQTSPLKSTLVFRPSL